MPSPETTVTPYLDGPLLVRGPFRLIGSDGSEITLRRRTVALCRCGRSRIPPLCDGTHQATGFRAEGRSGADTSND
ncbi:MAG: CDGSH iron-sulfur domain-containing protein [Thermoleophilaceae bacterium]